MNLRARLALLMVLLMLLPALPAAWMTREVIQQSLNLGLSEDVDAALEAGVRQTRQNYQHQRDLLAQAFAAWVAETVSPEAGSSALLARDPAQPDAGLLANLQLLLTTPAGEEHLLWGSEQAFAAAAPADDPNEPPRSLAIEHALPDGGVLKARCPLSAEWRADARTMAATLQVVRGLQFQRSELERGFWLPFLGVYCMALLCALAAAAWLGRGITRPVQRLLEATAEVAAGRRNVQVPAAGRDEVGRLSERFNAMVRTLDAQSRHLVDLETMAGWREMARALAHEIKNPLTPIQLTVEEMRERYRGDDAEYAALIEECTRIVVQEVESLRNVVARFREFSRPVEPRFVRVDLNRLVADMAALQRDMQAEVDLAPNLDTVDADPDQMRQMLMNLARNAQTATHDQTNPRLRLATRPAGNYVVIGIEEDGPGSPAAEQGRVFEPYRTGSAGGMGLGLALVKGIVLAHRGAIEVEEGRWGGARFRITLPRRQEGADG